MKRIYHFLNNKNTIVILFLFVSTLLKAQPPVANFNYFDVCVAQPANFTDTSTDAPDTWTWYFEGGSSTTSTLQHPTGINYAVAGVYEVKLVVSNIYGADSITQYINVYNYPIINFNITDVVCNGDANGSAEAIVGGGAMPYNYVWSPGGQTSQTATNLLAGNYSVTVTDINGCVSQDNITVNEPTALFASLTPTDVSCNGMADGVVSASVVGGVTPYTYSWSPGGETTATINNLTPGNYTVTITDANGCQVVDNTDILEPTLINANLSTVNVTCNGMADGVITSSPVGGQTPYTYLWSPGGQVTPTITNLAAGNYSLTVTDATGCQVIENVTVTEPSALVINLPNESICLGDTGSLTAFPSGGVPPYTYSWNDPLFTTTDVMTDFPTSTTNYTVTVTDANACVGTANADITVNSLPVVNIYDTTICEGGTISLAPSISGGTPGFSYFWSPGGETTSTLIDNPLTSTSYILNVNDANLCTGTDTALVTVNPLPVANPSFMSICEDALGIGTFDLSILNNSVNGGTGNTVSWYEDPGLTQYISGISAFVTGSTTLYVDVESPELCHSYASVELQVKDSATNVITGIVNYQSSPITSGSVKLIRKEGNLPSDMEIIQTELVSVGGQFLFSNVPQGDYIVKAYGDTLLYDNIPTYSGDVSDWASAMEYSIVATCDDTVSIGIELIVEPTNSGLGSISGILIQDDGQGLFNKAPGDPIPDIDITVDQSPGGTTMSATTTDINGNFTFEGLAAGDYIIYADMLGYTTTPQVITFDGSNMTQSITLCSNDTLTTVDVCSSITTSITSLPNGNQFNIYPNPVSDKLTIEFDGSEKIEINIIDMQGRLVLKENNLQSNSILDVSNLSNGVYQLKFVGTNSYSIQKILIQR